MSDFKCKVSAKCHAEIIEQIKRILEPLDLTPEDAQQYGYELLQEAYQEAVENAI